MKKILASLGILGALAYFGLSSQKEPELALGSQTVNAQIEQSPMGTFNFGDIPDYLLSVNSTGTISIQTVGKSFSIEPSNLAIGKRPGRVKSALLNVSPKAHGVLLDKPYGDGTEIEISTKEKKMSKVVKLERSAIGALNGEYLEVSFNLGGDTIVPDGVYTGRVEIAKNVWLEKGTAWDSNMTGDPNQNYIDVVIEVSDGKLIKKIPVSWLKTAQFPIYTDAIFTFGTKEFFDTGVVSAFDVATIGTNKFVTCWTDNSDGTDEGECIISTVSGTDITFGATSTFVTDSPVSTQTSASCAAGTDRWVVVYSEQADSSDGTARVASSTGTTINGYGTPFDFFDGASASSFNCKYVSTDRVVIAYVDDAGGDVEVVACNIQADYTLTCGQTQILKDTSGTPSDTDCAVLDTDKFICAYHDFIFDIFWMRVGNISGTSTITLGVENASVKPETNTEGHSMISPASNSFALALKYSSGSIITSPFLGLVLGTVSGTSTITLGATSTLLATTTGNISLTAIDADSAFLMYQKGTTDGSVSFLSAMPIEMNFTTRTFSTSTSETIDTTTDPGSLHAAKIGDCKFAFAWEDDNDTNDLFAIIGDTVGCGVSAFDDIIWFD